MSSYPAAPAGWTGPHSSRSHPGRVYYVCTATGEAQWDAPGAAVASAAGPAQVRASHILVKHAGSRNPSSWRCPHVTCTKEEAITKLLGLLELVTSGRETFESVAARESDCSSARNGGDLGHFGRGAMQKPFEDAAFGLEVGQMSGVVDTASGVHIVLRTE